MVDEMVSIVMATYNGEKYLRQQLDSILEQSYPCIELIVVDDASLDGTLSILHEYATLDSRVCVFPAKNNLGLVANFERGVMLAKGVFIAFSDQDDIFRKDKIELQVEALKANPYCDMVVSDLSLIDGGGNLIAASMWHDQRLVPQPGHPFRRLLYKNFATGCAMMIRRRLLEIALPFSPNCIVHDWWLAVISASDKAGGICLVSEPLTAYRQHESNVIGACEKPYTTILTVRKIIARVAAKPRERERRGITIADSRKQMNRLDGYLLRDCWSQSDRLAIENTRRFHQRLIALEHNNFFDRLLCAGQRVSYARMTGRSAREIAEVFYFTVFPFK